jgi:hypothetical protein
MDLTASWFVGKTELLDKNASFSKKDYNICTEVIIGTQNSGKKLTCCVQHISLGKNTTEPLPGLQKCGEGQGVLTHDASL